MVTATWTRTTQAEQLKRSSLTVAVAPVEDGEAVIIFGGELEPRKPRDNDVLKIAMQNRGEAESIDILHATVGSPSRRVGAASIVVDGKVCIFSGRGGEVMAPLEEHGKLWLFCPKTEAWSSMSNGDSSLPYPQARSYHCMTSNGKDALYLHAGCPEKGRLSDLWEYDTYQTKWTKLSDAPDPPRGGSSIAYAEGKVYRMNGFDGKCEQGGSLDVYDTEQKTWSSLHFEADGKAGPGSRSVSTLLAIHVNGRPSLITLFGESDPSSLGHQGAGKMLGDVWLYDINDGAWTQVQTTGSKLPVPRGWFDADVAQIDGKDAIVVAGGLGESNERLDDLWLLTL